MLNHYIQQGKLERISHGVYRFPEKVSSGLDALIKETLAAAPNAVVGLHTALQLHNLTDEAPPSIFLVVPENNFPKRKLQDVTLYRVKPALFSVQTEKKNGIPVTKLERTLVDLLRYGEPVSLIVETIRKAQSKRMKVSFTLLKRLASQFRVKGRMERVLEVFV